MKRSIFFVDNYIKLLQKHPHILGFIINELNHNPHILIDIIEKNTLVKQDHLVEDLGKQIENDVKANKIMAIDARSLLINILALCVFPVVAGPVLTGVLFDNDSEAYELFIGQRKDLVKEFIKNAFLL